MSPHRFFTSGHFSREAARQVGQAKLRLPRSIFHHIVDYPAHLWTNAKYEELRYLPKFPSKYREFTAMSMYYHYSICPVDVTENLLHSARSQT